MFSTLIRAPVSFARIMRNGLTNCQGRIILPATSTRERTSQHAGGKMGAEVSRTAAKAEGVESGFKIRHLRWYICGLLFLATTINYIDRQVLGILAPDLQRDIGWS